MNLILNQEIKKNKLKKFIKKNINFKQLEENRR